MSTQSPVARPPRYEVRLGAEVTIDGKVATATTRNLSAGGVCIALDRPLKEGAPLALSLFLVEDDVESAAAKTLQLSAVVQWVAEADRGYTAGLKFHALNPQQTAALKNVLARFGEG